MEGSQIAGIRPTLREGASKKAKNRHEGGIDVVLRMGSEGRPGTEEDLLPLLPSTALKLRLKK